MRFLPLCLFLAVGAAAQTGPVDLFNGRDLSGWQVYGTEEWYVEDSTLVCESGPDEGYGYLGSDAIFRDFDLSADFFQESNGNSGLFFRSFVTGTRIRGWQAEIAPLGYATGGIYESYGRGWLAKPDSTVESSAFREGEWNTIRVRVQGGHVQTWLNSVPMVDFEDEVVGRAAGRIALQIHDGGAIKVRWRSIRITTL